jgi:hypothetical protein
LSFLAREKRKVDRATTGFSPPVNSGRETPAILTGRLTCDLPKCACEIGLAGKIERERDIDQRLIASRQ